MKRGEAQQVVAKLLEDFCADDVKCWLVTACRFKAAEYEREAGSTASEEIRALNVFAEKLEAVENQGV